MPNSDPPPADDQALTGDAVRRLEERLDRASAAAERLIAEAAAQARGSSWPRREGDKSDEPRPEGDESDEPRPEGDESREPPPAGWQRPRSDEPRSVDGDLELLSQVFQSVRDLIPPELQRRLAEALRELLLALRALIDFYLERLERRRKAPPEVEDIPIS